MPFPGPSPDTPWSLLPPSEGVPYFRYVQKGTPSTYGDSPDGGHAPAYNILPLLLTGTTAAGLMWVLGKYTKVPVDVRTYTAAFSTAAASRALFDVFGADIMANGVVGGLKKSFTDDPRRAFAGIGVGIVGPILAQKLADAEVARRNRRNRR